MKIPQWVKWTIILIFILPLFSVAQTTTLSSSNPSVPAASIYPNTQKITVYQFSLISTATPNLTGLSFVSNAGYSATDVTRFQLWTNTANNLTTATQLSTDIIASLGPGTHSFAAFTVALSTSARYFWITVDVSSAPVVGNILTVAALTTTNLTVSAGTKAGTASIGGAQTFTNPHNNCNQCHINHTAPGGQITGVNGNANLCMSCHNSAGVASLKPFDNAMKAVPGTSGTSHAWDKAAVNATYESNTPSDAQLASRLPGSQIICSTCHDQHNDNTNNYYTRISNSGDNMCKNCHVSRNVGRWADNNTLNKGSHPVGVTYTGTGSVKATPTSPLQTISGKVECSSCHKTHYATSTDGNILRATNNDVLCTSCHTYGSHQGQGCKVCHDTHNTNKTNIYQIKDNVITPNSGSKAVIFTAESGAGSFADGASPYNGICEVCHTLAASAYHLNNSPGTHNNGTDCTTCHPHSNNFSPIGCHNCHDSSLPNLYPATGAHATHSGPPYNYKCETCHYQYGQGGALEPTHGSGTVNVVFKPTGLARRNGLDSNTPSYNSTTKVCTNVYCHSDGRSAYRGTDGTYTWSATTGSQPATYATTPSWTTGTITACTACHSGAGNMTSPYTIARAYVAVTPPATGSHQRGAHTSNSQEFSAAPYLTPYWAGVQCFWCHDPDGTSANGPKLQGTYGSAYHIDGLTYFKPLNYANGGTMANGLSYSSNGSAAHCGAGKKCW
jgi:predicted CxxxxCH...CXXCH cytochrome family protein